MEARHGRTAILAALCAHRPVWPDRPTLTDSIALYYQGRTGQTGVGNWPAALRTGQWRQRGAGAPHRGHNAAQVGRREWRYRRGKLEAGIRNRTVVHGFAGRCITTLPPRRGWRAMPARRAAGRSVAGNGKVCRALRGRQRRHRRQSVADLANGRLDVVLQANLADQLDLRLEPVDMRFGGFQDIDHHLARNIIADRLQILDRILATGL